MTGSFRLEWKLKHAKFLCFFASRGNIIAVFVLNFHGVSLDFLGWTILNYQIDEPRKVFA